ncbi:hypothetical protein OWR28_19805 [Chryseobacterium sp. 1B4]
MKKHLFPLFLLLLGLNAQAQQDFFAITGKDTQSITFNDFRAIDGTNGVSGEKFLRQILLQEYFHKLKKVL